MYNNIYMYTCTCTKRNAIGMLAIPVTTPTAPVHLEHGDVCEGLCLKQQSQVLHHLRQLVVQSKRVLVGGARRIAALLPGKNTSICAREGNSLRKACY